MGGIIGDGGNAMNDECRRGGGRKRSVKTDIGRAGVEMK